MIKRVFTIFTLTLLFLFSNPVYSLDTSSKNLDAKGVFEWMMEKPNDWIGKK